MSRPSSRTGRWRAPLALLLGSALLAALTPASKAGDNEAVINAIQSFLYQQSQSLGDEIRIEVFPPAADFDTCASPSPFLPHGNGQPQLGRVSVGVRCNGNSRSVRYMTAQVSVIGEYPQLARSVERGTIISADMLETTRGNLAQLPAYAVTDIGQAVGQMAKRPLSAGSLLRQQDLKSIPVVERGQEVVIEHTGSGFRVTRKGEALQSGAMGETIRVRLSRRENLVATVSGQGRVSVD